MKNLRQHLVVMVTLLLLFTLALEGAGETSKYTGKETDKEQCSGNCTGIKAGEEYYFDGYADISIHETMISDTARTDTYRNAIFHNIDLIKDKVVADIGAGTGILSMFCVQAGAKKVYAIEASDLAKLTQKIIKDNNMEDKITVVSSKVEISELPEKIDVIVSEWMGYSLLFENMLPSVLFARDKWLNEGGAILPNTADLYLAPIKSDGYYDERMAFWDTVTDDYQLDMSRMKELAIASLTKRSFESVVRPADVMSGAAKVKHFDIGTMKPEDLKVVQNTFGFRMYSKAKVYGFTIWFDVDFPGGFTLSTSPFEKPTHWSQTVVYVEEPFVVPKGTTLSGSIVLKPNHKNDRFLDVILEYKVEGKDSVKKTYIIDG